MAAGISIPHEQIAAFCQRWNITHLALFGSVLRRDFGRRVDLINRRTIERSSNYIRRREILGSARTIYN
jgi:hypothetical protein